MTKSRANFVLNFHQIFYVKSKCVTIHFEEFLKRLTKESIKRMNHGIHFEELLKKLTEESIKQMNHEGSAEKSTEESADEIWLDFANV